MLQPFTLTLRAAEVVELLALSVALAVRECAPLGLAPQLTE